MLLCFWIIWWWYESLHIIKLMLWDFINCCYHQIFAGHVVNAVAPEDSFTYLEKLRTGPGEDRMAWNISFIPSGTIDGLLIRFSFYGIYDICLLIEWTCWREKIEKGLIYLVYWKKCLQANVLFQWLFRKFLVGGCMLIPHLLHRHSQGSPLI